MLKVFLILAAAAAIAVAAPSSPLLFNDIEDADLLEETSDDADDNSQEECSSSQQPCPAGQYALTNGGCARCPNDKPATAYGVDVLNCGVQSCISCDKGYDFTFRNMCLTTKQRNQVVAQGDFLKEMVAVGALPRQDVPAARFPGWVRDPTATTSQEKKEELVAEGRVTKQQAELLKFPSNIYKEEK
jgi:hypothetical protein